MNVKIKINNVPDYATKGFIVARSDEHLSWWFYGCYETEERARIASHEIGGNYFEIAGGKKEEE